MNSVKAASPCSLAITIVVPCYNARPWIGETLASAAQRSPFPVDLIVVDDGSTDGSGEFISENFPQVKLVKTANRGCSAARTLGASLAKGDYILFLDADDLLVGEVLRQHWNLAEESRADVVYANWQRLVPVGTGWELGQKVERTWSEVSSDIELAFFTDMWCPTAAYLWRTDFLRRRHPGWHPNLPIIQDARFALDAAMAGARFVHLPEVAVYYRTHGSGSVSTSSRLKFARDCWINALEVCRTWDSQGRLTEERKKAVLTGLEELALGNYHEDPSFARQVAASARDLDPLWHPRNSWLRYVLGSLLGFEGVAKSRLLMDQLRSRAGKWHRYD